MTVRRSTAIVAAAALALVLGVVGGGQIARAATFVVNSTADAPDANPGDGVCAAAGGACTLRAAVEETNALAGADTITLPAGSYVLNSALLPSGDLTVTGAGTGSTFVSAINDAIFWLSNGTITFNVSGITFQETDSDCILITGTSGAGPGASGSTLNVTNSVFSGCLNAAILAGTDQGNGGPVTINIADTLITVGSEAYYGVLMDTIGGSFSADNVVVERMLNEGLYFGFNADGPADVSITDSTIRDNEGGMVMFTNAGTPVTVDVANSTFDGNLLYHAGFAGTTTVEDTSFVNSPGENGTNGWGFEWVGLRAEDELVVRRSTVADNIGYGVYLFPRASTQEALFENVTISGNGRIGISTNGDVRFVNSTIVGNGEFGVGAYGTSNTFLNTIVAGNTDPDDGGAPQPADCDVSIETLIVSEGGNIDGDGSCGFTQPSDQPSTDPLLGPLADNGGPTLTHLPAAGSPAIDGGVATGCPATDQRGTSRPQGAACDAGSVEVASQAVTTTTVAPTTVAPTTVAPTTVAPTTVAPTTVAPTTVAPSPPAPATVAPTLPATGSGDPERTTAGLALAALLAGLALIAISRRRTT